MELKDCKTLDNIRQVIKEASDEKIFNLWKSGDLRKKAAELKCSNELYALDNMNLNTSKSNIVEQLKKIFEGGCGCVVLLFFISIPLNIAVGYALFTSFVA